MSINSSRYNGGLFLHTFSPLIILLLLFWGKKQTGLPPPISPSAHLSSGSCIITDQCRVTGIFSYISWHLTSRLLVACNCGMEINGGSDRLKLKDGIVLKKAVLAGIPWESFTDTPPSSPSSDGWRRRDLLPRPGAEVWNGPQQKSLCSF